MLTEISIVGMRFRFLRAKNPIDLLATWTDRIHAGDPFILEREPENTYDINAIKVLAYVGEPADGGRLPVFVGYIPRDIAAELAFAMDSRGLTKIHSNAELGEGFANDGSWTILFNLPEPLEA